MKTGDLIEAIAADAGAEPKRPAPALMLALGGSAVAAGALFFAALGPRPDIVAALGTMRFPFKFVVTLAFGLAAVALALRLARPGAAIGPAAALLFGAVALLAVAIGFELATVPSDAWEPRLVGRNATLCLASIPLLSAAPLVLILAALGRGAPDRPAALGAAAGLLAGAVGATFYAAHCVDDSPLFVAVWYTLAVGLVTIAGAAIGSRVLKW
jgi:hypothetical protein